MVCTGTNVESLTLYAAISLIAAPACVVLVLSQTSQKRSPIVIAIKGSNQSNPGSATVDSAKARARRANRNLQQINGFGSVCGLLRNSNCVKDVGLVRNM